MKYTEFGWSCKYRFFGLMIGFCRRSYVIHLVENEEFVYYVCKLTILYILFVVYTVLIIQHHIYNEDTERLELVAFCGPSLNQGLRLVTKHMSIEHEENIGKMLLCN